MLITSGLYQLNRLSVIPGIQFFQHDWIGLHLPSICVAFLLQTNIHLACIVWHGMFKHDAINATWCQVSLIVFKADCPNSMSLSASSISAIGRSRLWMPGWEVHYYGTILLPFPMNCRHHSPSHCQFQQTPWDMVNDFTCPLCNFSHQYFCQFLWQNQCILMIWS